MPRRELDHGQERVKDGTLDSPHLRTLEEGPDKEGVVRRKSTEEGRVEEVVREGRTDE